MIADDFRYGAWGEDIPTGSEPMSLPIIPSQATAAPRLCLSVLYYRHAAENRRPFLFWLAQATGTLTD